MSFVLMDNEGYLGDFATHQGVRDLLARKDIPALQQFIHSMEADADLVKLILVELDGKKGLQEYSDLFHEAVPPVTLSDGIETE